MSDKALTEVVIVEMNDKNERKVSSEQRDSTDSIRKRLKSNFSRRSGTGLGSFNYKDYDEKTNNPCVKIILMMEGFFQYGNEQKPEDLIEEIKKKVSQDEMEKIASGLALIPEENMHLY